MKLTPAIFVQILRKRAARIIDFAENDYHYAIANEFDNLADDIEDAERKEDRRAVLNQEGRGE